ncbi:DUF4880 domain-containing protein [Alloalcanivorax xenomutans]|uniref:FecR family protein n=1 Tax=Alloalcanivorax xenomutans TaxID=1094342 RepID=UPI0013D3322F
MAKPAFSSSDDDSKSAIQTEARAWARKLATGRPTLDDAEALKRWCARSPEHARAWRQASAEWKALGDVMKTRAARAGRPGRVTQASRRRFLSLAFGSAAAAGAAAMARPPLGLWPSWSELTADYRTAVGEQRDVQISGHVRVALNTRTSIAVQRREGRPLIALVAGEVAVVNESGTAVEVKAGTGLVRLPNGCVEMRRLNTGQVRLSCTEGRAELRHRDRSVSLHAGEQVVYDDREVSTVASVASGGVSAWRAGVVVFDGTRLAEAVDEINRYRPGKVLLINDSLAQKRISGRFRIDALNQAILLIEELYQAQVSRIGDVVLLS